VVVKMRGVELKISFAALSEVPESSSVTQRWVIVGDVDDG
jgi:hypothetical protein